MKKGIVIFAHNNRQIDYAKMSLISAKLAKKHLGVPVSLITDPSTLEWLHESNTFALASEIFENIHKFTSFFSFQIRKLLVRNPLGFNLESCEIILIFVEFIEFIEEWFLFTRIETLFIQELF